VSGAIHQLDGEQYAVLLTLVKYGVTHKEPAVFILAAVETGLVEDSLHNRDTATASNPAVGWRQEEPPYGSTAERLDMSKSVPNFYRECHEHYRAGMTSGLLAAEVQRPLEAYRGRYGERAVEAQKLIEELGKNAGTPVKFPKGGTAANAKPLAVTPAKDPPTHHVKVRASGNSLSQHGTRQLQWAHWVASVRKRKLYTPTVERSRNVRA